MDLVLTAPAPPWQPKAGSPQEQAFHSAADVLGYGGAAGGMKTDTILGLAVCAHRRSLVIRREATQLRAIVDRLREILGPLGRFNENTGVWRGLPGGRQIELGGVKDPGDEQKYRGRPHDLLAIDEADQVPEGVFRFLMGWLRTAEPGQRCRAVLTFNPPASAEGRWLLGYFAPWMAFLFPRKFAHPRPAAPGELRWYATLSGGKEVECKSGSPFEHNGETITPKSRTFIPSRVTDNPWLMATGYLAQLQAMPEPLRSQLIAGDMTAGLEDDPWQVIPTDWVEAAVDRWRRMDAHAPGPPAGVRLSALGVDVARGGKDQTVIARRYGAWWAPILAHPGKRTPDGDSVARLVKEAVAENTSALVCIDAIGVGSSPYDACRRLMPGARVLAVLSGNAIAATDRAGLLTFANVRAYAYWSLRELLDPRNGHDLALPPDSELLADLTAPKWSLAGGAIKVEKKEEIIRRIGRSPDKGDAVVYSILLPPGG